MKPPFLFPSLLASVMLFSTGCVSVDPRSLSSSSAVSTQQVSEEMPIEQEVTDQQVLVDTPSTDKSTEKKSVRDVLTREMVFETLAGELSLQRRNMKAARLHLLEAARLARDPLAAERAMKVAMMEKNTEGALEAGKLWVEIAPDDLLAHQLNTVLAMRTGNEEIALESLVRMVEISIKTGADVFRSAMSASLQDKDHGMAKRLMTRLIEAFPEQQDGAYILGLMAMMRNDLVAAEDHVSSLLKQHPSMIKAISLLARIRLAAKDRDGALEVLNEGVKNAPEDPALRASIARLLLESDETDEAYKHYQVLVKLNPKDYDAVFILGVLALQLENKADARSWFQSLHDSGNRINDSAFYLGWIDEEDGKIDQAKDWYQSIDGGKTHTDARQRLAALIARDDLDAAREILQHLRTESASREEEVEIYLLEVSLLNKYADEAAIYRLYEIALIDLPDDVDLLYARAMFAISKDKIEILEQDLRRVLELKPDHADALNALGYTLTDRTDRHQEALGYIQQAMKLKPDSVAVLDSMGWINFRLGNHEDALKYLIRAHEKSEDGEIAAHLGEVLWVSGDQEQARKIWSKAQETDPDSEYLKKTLERFIP